MGQIIKMSSRSLALALRCMACGAEADAACDCGANYEPASMRAEKAFKDNPMKSNRAIAQIAGVSEPTVRRLRISTASHDAVDAPLKTVGLDGKARPARMARPKSKVVVLERVDYGVHLFMEYVFPWFQQLDETEREEFSAQIRKEMSNG